MSNGRLPDPATAQRLAADPRRSVWVSASAGTGKTKVLTDRVLGLLLAGTPPHRLLCLTFTKAAAAEMANRIHDRLSVWAGIDDASLARDLDGLLGRPADEAVMKRARTLFAGVLDAPGGMRIETIHAFCQALLRRFPLEAGLAPHFQVMDDRDSAEMLAQSRDDVLRAARAGCDPMLASAVETLALSLHEGALDTLLGTIAAERGRLARLRERFVSLDGAGRAVARRLGVEAGETAAGMIARACADEAFDAPGCRRVLPVLLSGGKTDREKAEAMASWLAADPSSRAARFPEWRAVFLTVTDGKPRTPSCTKTLEKKNPGTMAVLAAEAQRLICLDAHLRSLATARATGALLVLADALLDAYERRKAARAMLDYDDLILSARRLLEREGNTAWVLYKLDGGIDHILIDEAQDTNPDQWALVRALSDEFFAGRGVYEEGRRTIFAVGDPKQSIYSFQRADPAEFESMRGALAEKVPESGGLWNEVALNVSFRSSRAVLEAVDLVFNSPQGADGVVALGSVLRHLAWRDKAAGRVEIWPAVEPRATDPREPWKPPVERGRGDSPRGRLARLVAARIQAMLDGETLESRGRPIRPGDIMVLVRRRNAFVEELSRELKILSIPVAGVDRMVLTEQMAVMDLMALGRTLLLPEDDLTLATVLKGPLIGLSEEDLFALAHGRRGSLIEALRGKGEEEPFAGARRWLERWAGLAGRLSVHEFYAEILAKGGKERLLSRLGAEAGDPLDEFMNATLAFERMHPPSLQGFLAWVGSGGVEIKRDLETGGGMVRVMTVHGAKGLQAPIVFLPDTLQAPKQLPSLLWLKDEDAELPLWAPRVGDLDDTARAVRDGAALARDREYRRLLYVAMTRAEDRLILCGWRTLQTPPSHCWYALAREAVEGRAEEVPDPFLAGRPEIDDARVLRLSCRQEEALIEAPPATDAIPAAPLPGWATASAPAEPLVPRPLAPSRPDEGEPASRSPLDGDDRGARFLRGRLIHRLLQSLPDVPLQQREAAAARFVARPGWGVSPGEQEEIVAEAIRVLSDPEWRELFGPGSRAEVPVVGLVEGRAVSAQIDRLLVKAEEVLIVDFKSNRPPPLTLAGVAPAYLRQLAVYRSLLSSVYPGRRIRCALLWTDGPRLMAVPEPVLAGALSALSTQ